ncbi:MAG: thymidine phosphorylase [Mycoplasmatales bacterium]
MNIIEIINKKKEKKELSKLEIEYFITEYTKDKIPDYQISALLMTIYLNGMSKEEMVNLTISMMNSGQVLTYESLNKVIVDKHSTGGVGDKTSLVLIPLLASLDFAVSKMSGRGLGHTGGTIDKLESFIDFNVEKTKEEIYQQIQNIGCVIVGQSAEIVPADKKLYALRDVTGTVNSIPLIASSIMSKKLALGAEIILLDVKYGNGAFMKTFAEAEVLAKAMIDIGNGIGKKTIACITSMEQPLGKNIGNVLEVQEAIATLQGQGNEELAQLCIELASEFLIIRDNLTKKEAKEKVKNIIKLGTAYPKFEQLLLNQGVKKENLNKLVKAKYSYEYKIKEEGYIKEIIADKIGTAAMLLGAGRKTKEDLIDLSVGFEFLKKVGDYVTKEETIILIHYNDEIKLKQSIELLNKAYIITKNEVNKPQLIEKIIK